MDSQPQPGPGLVDIFNFLPLSDRLATAGQPTREQFAAIGRAGFQVVINLALPESPNALPDERAVVEAQGMEHIHIPVQWEAPRTADALRFFEAMREASSKKVFVHCAANMRVSAFIYLYRTLCEGVPPESAAADLHRIWEPNEAWRRFMAEMKNSEEEPGCEP